MRPKKLGDTTGVADWKNLNSPGDCKRLLRWLILSMRNGSLQRQDAAVMCQLGAYLLKAVEVTELEARIQALEQRNQGITISPYQNGGDHGPKSIVP